MDAQKVAESVGAFWSKVSSAADSQGIPLRVRWWQQPLIIRHINQRVLGRPVDGASQGLIERARTLLAGRTLEKGISVGCGAGQKEINLVRQKIVASFDLYEFSDERIEIGRKAVARLGMTDAIRFIKGDAFQLSAVPESYDLVHWNNALHHMLDVEEAVAWSHKVLKPGGLFYMDDFVGPSRFQWSEKMLGIATAVRESLPASYLANPRVAGKQLPTKVPKVDAEKLRAVDPSEAADSSRILDSVKNWFPEAEIILTGGVVYHLALSELLANFDDARDEALLKLLLLIDDLCTDLGETHYGVALGFKK